MRMCESDRFRGTMEGYEVLTQNETHLLGLND